MSLFIASFINNNNKCGASWPTFENQSVNSMDIFNLLLLVGTYSGRSRRSSILESYEAGAFSDSTINLSIAERQILRELGPKACIIEEPCRIHANKRTKIGDQPDWENILRYLLVALQ
jgi:hypothetical protein